jgi:hypothetical protein
MCRGGETFSNVVRAAIREGMVMMVSESCKHGAYSTTVRVVRLCCPLC